MKKRVKKNKSPALCGANQQAGAGFMDWDFLVLRFIMCQQHQGFGRGCWVF